MFWTKQKETNLPPQQYEQDCFSSRKDCIKCGRVLGAKVTQAWLSATDEGIMNLGFECVSCHARTWERIPVPEVVNE